MKEDKNMGFATIELLNEKLEPFNGTLVIGDFFKIVRLSGVIDGGDDYYWIYDTPKGIVHSSCVGSWIPLKGFISDDSYNRLVEVWNLNNINKAL